MTYRGGPGVGGWEGIYVFIELIHFAVQQKLTQHCKATIRQKKLIKKRRALYYNMLLGLSCYSQGMEIH